MFVYRLKSLGLLKKNKMGEGECELPLRKGEHSKKSRHRKKHLYSNILQQMEFYFSDSNISKDRFLSQKLSEASSVELELFLKFNKIKKLNCTVEDIKKAIKKSELIGVTEDGLSVYRKVPVKVRDNVDLCTIYVENIKADANHESLSQIFSDFGKVLYVSIPKYKHNKANKGFAFIEYETEEQAQEAISFFNSIGCKIPLEKNPEELQSIVTFEGNEGDQNNDSEMNKISRKRKLSTETPEEESKKVKLEINTQDENNDNQQVEPTEESKKKKKNKKDKRKNFIKELGMQVLSKKEWKRLRNHYLDLQKKKMREFKQYLYKQKYNNTKGGQDNTHTEDGEQTMKTNEETLDSKLQFVPGVIVKLHLSEPCSDVKKLKNDLKAFSTEVKYVDIPLPFGSEEVFVRFSSSESATEFSKSDYAGEKTVLTGDEEKGYWEKIANDRQVKFQKSNKKVRGRDKLLKKAEKESAKHLRFEENE